MSRCQGRTQMQHSSSMGLADACRANNDVRPLLAGRRRTWLVMPAPRRLARDGPACRQQHGAFVWQQLARPWQRPFAWRTRIGDDLPRPGAVSPGHMRDHASTAKLTPGGGQQTPGSVAEGSHRSVSHADVVEIMRPRSDRAFSVPLGTSRRAPGAMPLPEPSPNSLRPRPAASLPECADLTRANRRSQEPARSKRPPTAGALLRDQREN